MQCIYKAWAVKWNRSHGLHEYTPGKLFHFRFPTHPRNVELMLCSTYVTTELYNVFTKST